MKKQKAPETLADLKPGQKGIVMGLHCTGALKKRLFDMGITPGVEIKIRKIAPLGDPMEIRLRGYALSIRKGDAKNIPILLEAQEESGCRQL